jgi:hypothetical protein
MKNIGFSSSQKGGDNGIPFNPKPTEIRPSPLGGGNVIRETWHRMWAWIWFAIVLLLVITLGVVLFR